MIMRPEVRIVQSQEVEIKDAHIDSWEAEQLMRKYGYYDQHQQDAQLQTDQSGLTFEEMVAQEEARLRNERMAAQQRANAPRPISFDGARGYDTETRYGSDEESGYGFKIQITSDMPLPKY